MRKSLNRYKQKLEAHTIPFARKMFLPLAHFSFFVIFFWFGLLKVLKLSPANSLAEALAQKTVGMQYFDALFLGLAVFECVIGLLFLFQRFSKQAVAFLIVHMGIVCSPLLLVPELTWQQFGVPTLEGQYIIKNIVVVALAIGILAFSDKQAKSPHKTIAP
ncbi:MAG TPA: hypothetical protein PKD15_04040 [Candidatus Saccharibacteria bacterium]|jgi:uncharacterized membrane protein YkgB|nr:hypothetical protein [Candidatus Saccharibacteria bacterium]